MNYFLKINMIGKDSIPYCETKEIDEVVFNVLKDLIKGKKPTDKVFVHADSSTVNNYLKSIYDGEISPKMFRTCKAGLTLAKEIQCRKWKNLTDKEFKNNLMECCLQTSILLNHHKTVSEEQKKHVEEKSNEKLEFAKFTRDRCIKNTQSKLKKLKQTKKDYESCLEGKILEKKLNEISIREKELNDKIKFAKKKYDDTVQEIQFKMDSVDVNLGTSLNAYSTPRLPLSLCKYADKNPRLIYSEAQLKKFEWANDVDSSYWKKYPKI